MPSRPRTDTGEVAPAPRRSILAGFYLDRAAEHVDPASGVARVVRVVTECRGTEVAHFPLPDREAPARVRSEEAPHVEILHPVLTVYPVLCRALAEGEHQEPAPIAARGIRAAIEQALEHRQRELREAVQVLVCNRFVATWDAITGHGRAYKLRRREPSSPRRSGFGQPIGPQHS